MSTNSNNSVPAPLHKRNLHGFAFSEDVSKKINNGLTRHGYEQAHKTAKKSEHNFTSIHSSPLKRARDTAYIMARHNPQAGHIKPTEALLPASHPSTSAPVIQHVNHQLSQLSTNPRPLNITHSHTLHALREAVNGDSGTPISHASLHRLDPESMKLTGTEKFDKPGVYFMRHAEDVQEPKPNSKEKSHK